MSTSKTVSRSRQKPGGSSSGRAPWLVAAAAIGAVLIALLVAAITADSGNDVADDPDVPGPESSYGIVIVEGDPLPRLPEGATIADDPAAGAQAPIATAIDVAGMERRIGEGSQLVAFLAHWCSHCQREVPIVVDWVDAGGVPDGVELLAVATSTDPGQPNFPPLPWLQREGWSAPIVLDDEASTAGLTFGVSSYPFWVALDSEGRVLARISGVLEPDQLTALAQAVASS